MPAHVEPADSGPSRTILERLLGETEPVRRALYPVVIAAVALLVFYGRLDPNSVPLWLALAVGVLGLGGTEAARRVAWAPRTVGKTVTAYAEAWREHAEAEFERGLDSAEGPVEPGPAESAVTAELRVGAHRPDRCREVEGGRRCRLAPHREPDEGGVPHLYD